MPGDLAGFRLDRTFRLVLIAMNTLQALTEPADRLACLSAARDHLAPGGELIFDVALPDAEEIVATMGIERPGGLHHDPGSGAMLEHSAWYDRWEPDTHTLEFTLRMEQRAAAGPPSAVLRRHRVHLFTPERDRRAAGPGGARADRGARRLRRLPGDHRLRAPDPPLPGRRVSTLRLCHLYPGEMNIYADRGNIAVLERRLAWRGLALEVTELGLGDRIEPGRHDLFYLGGGQDRDQAVVADDMVATKAEGLHAAVAGGAAVVCVCGGFQLAGRGYTGADGSRMPGVGILDLDTVAGPTRLIGDLVIEAELDGERHRLVGFENHAGRTRLGPGCRPLGRVVSGHGNNGDDGWRGGRVGHGSWAPTSTGRCCRRTRGWPTA